MNSIYLTLLAPFPLIVRLYWQLNRSDNISANIISFEQFSQMSTFNNAATQPVTNILTLGDGNMSFSFALSKRLDSRVAALRLLSFIQQFISDKSKQGELQHVHEQHTPNQPEQLMTFATECLAPFFAQTRRSLRSGPLYANLAAFQLIATSFDSEKELVDKYPSAVSFVKAFSQPHSNTTYHGSVNAVDIIATLNQSIHVKTPLVDYALVPETNSTQQPDNIQTQIEEASKQPQPESDQIPSSTPSPSQTALISKFHAIWFNNPHVGVEDHHKHIALLSHFFASARSLLSAPIMVQDEYSTVSNQLTTIPPQIIVTLCDDQPRRWELLQCAYRNFRLLCVAAIELTPAMWPQFENKRHQNDSAFPYCKMIQYYFMPVEYLPRDFVQSLAELFETYEQNQVAASWSIFNSSRLNPLPANGFELWRRILNHSVSQFQSSSTNENSSPHDSLSSLATDQLEASFYEYSQNQNNITLKPNWASSEDSFVPLVPVLDPSYAFFALPPIHGNTPSNIPLHEVISSASAQLAFSPTLSLSHILRAYRQQLEDIQAGLVQQHITSKLQRVQCFNTIIASMGGQTAQSTALSLVEMLVNSSTTPLNVQPASSQQNDFESMQRELLSKLPSGFLLPTHLDPLLLGRALTNREMTKLQRFISRSQPGVAQDKNRVNQENGRENRKARRTPPSNDNSNEISPQPTISQAISTRCTECSIPRDFPDAEALARHMKAKHSERGKLLRTEEHVPQLETGGLFTWSEWCSHHKETNESDQLVHICPLCGLICANQDIFQNHLDALSPQIIAQTCPGRCGKVFTNSIALEQHLLFAPQCNQLPPSSSQNQ